MKMLVFQTYFIWTNIIDEFIQSLMIDYIYYALMMIALLVGYLFTRPIIHWLISLKSVRLISYLLNGLLLLFSMLFMIILVDDLNHSLTHLFKIFLQCLAIFGIALTFYNLVWGRSRKYNRYR